MREGGRAFRVGAVLVVCLREIMIWLMMMMMMIAILIMTAMVC